MKVFQEKSGNLIEFKGISGKKDFDYEKQIQKLMNKMIRSLIISKCRFKLNYKLLFKHKV